ncbi:MAG: hypothetical protein KDA81_04835 [Planctomycetaceae bacterium]|nr:hypothetical protein [Planctomycetaceae bacterium]
MTGTVLERSLKLVAQRIYKVRILRQQALWWMLLVVPAIAASLMLPPLHDFFPNTLLILLGVTMTGLILSRLSSRAPTAVEAARLVEQYRPELGDAVLTAVRATEPRRDGRPASVMTAMLVEEASRLATQSDWTPAVSRSQMFRWSTLSFLSFFFLVTSVVAAGRWGRESIGSRASLSSASDLNLPVDLQQTDIVIEPGDVEIERGSAVTIVARFANSLPTAAMLRLHADDGTVTVPMDSTVDEGVFAVRLPTIESDIAYDVAFGRSADEIRFLDQPDFPNLSDRYRISTFVRPRLEQVDALITPPEYTGLPPQEIADTLRISAVEGSQVQLTLHLNKATTVAELHGANDVVIPLLPTDSEGMRVVATIDAVDNQQYRVHLQDAEGRTAREEETISLRVTRNQRPKIRITFPGRDTNVSPLQEFQVDAEATDDFGFLDYGFVYSLSSGPTGEISLKDTNVSSSSVAESGRQLSQDVTKSSSEVSAKESAKASPSRKIKMQHVLPLEELDAQPDQLLSYHFYVEDAAANGQRRRTYSDMMFAEVRRFEEIFREGQQQNQQQQQQQQQQEGGNQTEQLLQLQRQIMIATWNVQRSLEESSSRGAAVKKAIEDADVVRQSQEQALQQLLESMEEMAGDAEMTQLATSVQSSMQAAVEHLKRFAEDQSEDSLSDARQAEQSAFAGLMRMRAKEHEVTQSQSQSRGQGRQNSASQQQLRQLELDNERNRYESERQAQQQQEQNAEQNAELQILNRLKELARRQEMLNERMKQLESELRAAQTEEEKEEIERELKRLREEQREMLRDVDELRETMDQQSAEQRQRNQETREQVDQAREQLQQASRAMDEGNLQQAISEGTRAERQFDELQESFRQQTSNRFSDTMKDLRQQARDLSERQEQIARELNGQTQPERPGASDSPETPQRPSLRSDRDRDGLQEKVAQQRDELERVLERAKQVVEEAEESEPLLSRRLYDTVRDTREQKPQEALEATEILVSRGLWNQSQQAEQIARKGIDELTKGIERAADAVLGSEAESLRRAQEEIEKLRDQLSSEIAQATGQAPRDAEPSDSRSQDSLSREAGETGNEADRQSQPGNSSDQPPGTNESRQRIRRTASPPPATTQQSGNRSSQGDNPAEARQPGAGSPQDQSPEGDQQPGSGQTQQNPRQSRRQPGGGEQSGNQPGESENQPGQSSEGRQQEANGTSPASDESPSDQMSQRQSQSQQGGSPSQSGTNSGQQPGQDDQQESGQQGTSQQPAESESNQQQNGPAGAGSSSGQQSESRSPNGQQPGEQQSGGQQSGNQRGGGGSNQNSFLLSGGRESNNGGRGVNEGRPLTGDDFREWSDRMREVEEILDDPDLRNRVAQVRDRARSIRAEFKRHGTEPQWDLVKSQLLDEMTDLQRRLVQELSRLNSDRSMVPIDREPVPEEFDELVRRYYELLGQSRPADK